MIHLLEVSPVPGRTPLRDYLALRRELKLYDEALAARDEVIVVNKIDLPETRRALPNLRQMFRRRGLSLHAISTVTGEGIPSLLEACWKILHPTQP